ncbi:MAG: choice-of-anchor D domain-containing protein, partial [Deltaproteobacteria bacterium]|nr:choice-of-anchor D domain-containing protein [Deltaproteobacteria bacterium]
MLSAFLSKRNHHKRFHYLFILSIISLLAVLILVPLSSHNVRAADIALGWNPNPEPDIAGYKIYYGFDSRDYSEMVDVGHFTTCIIGDLESGVTYYFAATAYNAAGESDYSDEVMYTPTEPVTDIFVDPDIYYFGDVTIGDVSDVTITVTNEGIADLHIGTIGGLSAPFSIVTDNCSGETISQGNSRTFAVRFAPTTDASFDDIINISSDDPDENPIAIVTHGTGTPEPLENQPPVADAGSNQTVNEGDTVTLDGSSSSDIDDGIASYQWSQIS